MTLIPKNPNWTLAGPGVVLFAVAFLGAAQQAAAQRLIVISGGSGALGYDGCLGVPTGPNIPAGSGGLGTPGSARPGPNGHLYVVDTTLQGVRAYDSGGAFVQTFVTGGSGGLTQAWALAFGPSGNLFATSLSAGQPARVLQYNGTTGAFMGIFASVPGSISPTPWLQGLAFGPNGNLFVTSASYAGIIEFNGASGAFVRVITSPVSGLRGLTFGPDTNLFVASATANRILRFDLVSGTYLGDFVTAGSGGLSGPRDLAFGADGNLVVSSFGTNSIKAYDGESGSFLGDLGAGGPPTTPSGLTILWPAGVSAFGQSSPGCNGRPCVGVPSSPVLGTSPYQVSCSRVASNTSGVLAVSSGAYAAPLVTSGIQIWVDPFGWFFTLIPVASNSGGSSSANLAIPADPALAGYQGHLQFAWFDGCASGGLSASRAFTLTLQAPPPSNCSSDGAEPNNSCAAATSIPATYSFSGFLCPQNDEDWFQFTLPGPRDVSVQMTPPQSPCLNYDLQVYGACGSSPIASSVFGTCASESVVLTALAAGTYRIRVFAPTGQWNANAAYSMSVSTALPPSTVQTITSGSPVQFSGTTYPIFHQHPFLQTVFTPSYNETVSVAVFSNLFQMASCLNPWFYWRIKVNNVTIASGNIFQGTPSFGGSGTFTATAGVQQVVWLEVAFNCASFGGPMGQVPPAGGTGTMTITHTPQ